MSKGNALPANQRIHAKVTSPIAQRVTDGLMPFLDGMLKTIGQAGAGKARRGGGDLRAAVSGVNLLIESLSRSGSESKIAALLQEATKAKEGDEEWNEEDYTDPEGDKDLENLNDEIDEFKTTP